MNKYVLAALTMGVREYLLKARFRLAELVDRIKQPQLFLPTAMVAE